MAGTKQRLSKIREEAGKLFSLESTLQKSVTALNLGALFGVIYLTLPLSSKGKMDPLQTVILVILGLFLAANYIQHVVMMRLRAKWAEIEEQSSHDGLTKAFNREAFDDILEEEMSRARRYKYPLSLCIIDLDNFKAYNDTYGHPKGDRLLIDFADRVQKAIRSADCLARYGGDEFCVLLPHTDLVSAEKFLSRILPEIQEWLDFTFSAGVTSFRPNDNSLEFVTRADLALYQAKREGRNRIRCLIGEDDSPVVVKF